MGMAAGGREKKLSVCCISHRFYEAASRSPDRIAVIHASGFGRNGPVSRSTILDDSELASEGSASSACTWRPPIFDGDEYFTFSHILSAVENLSCRLRRILGADDPHSCLQRPNNNGEECTPKIIGIYMEPSAEYIVAVLSVLRCGGAFMPIDPTWPKARILSLLSSSKADLVIGIKVSTEEDNFHRLDKLQWLIDESNYYILPISFKEIINEQSPPSQIGWPCQSNNMRPFCYLMYTSGSSGDPKGVCGTEIGLLNRFLWMQEMYPLHDQDIIIFKTAISFIDHMQEFLGPVLTACTIVIPSFNRLRENMFYLLDILQGYNISRLVAVPSLMRAILPFLQSLHPIKIQDSLNILVLSGEILKLPYCKMLRELLPKTVILNLYGSTEVTGDCMYFDCKRLPMILENEELSSVPIGLPISNCDVLLVGQGAPYQGEIFVSGLCVAKGYFHYPYLIPLSQDSLSAEDGPSPIYFRTGDLARKLPSGDFVFLGRKDRNIKLNGQRIALEEVEDAFLDHPDVMDVAVLSREVDGEILFLEAYVVTRNTTEDNESLKSSLRNWLLRKLPQAMIPSHIVFTNAFPLTSSGKVDYSTLVASVTHHHEVRFSTKELSQGQLIQLIQEVFADALKVDKFSVGDDFFLMGGNSLSAAYVCFQLGIQMKQLYSCPTPLGLHMVLLSSCSSVGNDSILRLDLRKTREVNQQTGPKIVHSLQNKPEEVHFRNKMNGYYDTLHKRAKITSSLNTFHSNEETHFWNLPAVHKKCSFSRCNKSTHQGQCECHHSKGIDWESNMTGNEQGLLQELWKINTGACVDASALVISDGSNLFLFIGSHSHKFLCIDGKSGIVIWETQLEGRIECSAAILDDFSQVVVGCYLGNIYLLDFSDGNVCWSFRTNGEVKSQPVVDKRRHLIWFGSYDHNLYAIDYKHYSCIYKLPCGGSIFGSPAIDDMREKLYAASTSGQIVALEIKALPFKTSWELDMGAPIFSSLSVTDHERNVICCMVDGTVAALSTYGVIIWKTRTGGPIFAGPCTSKALPAQVLVTSRDGAIYSFGIETGGLIWKHETGNPITSSPYIDENLLLLSKFSNSSYRLVCVCDSWGNVHVLIVEGINRVEEDEEKSRKGLVREFGRIKLGGDIFSSPVMIGGRIFVGCRDDNVYCIELELEGSHKPREERLGTCDEEI